jgi:site-specific DNA-methyltransferase (adenine-specific)
MPDISLTLSGNRSGFLEYSGYDQKFESGKITLYQADCMKMLPQVPDNYYDLCICDPPYGIGMGCGAGETRGVYGRKKKDLYQPKYWDSSTPNKEYWIELFRISTNQIVFGGNYFSNNLPVSRGWVYWRKLMGGNYSDGELVWTSFDMILKEFTKRTEQGETRFHPTQKPVALYRWLLDKYAKPLDRILDTHLGSGSIAIACDELGFDLEGYEIDKDYYDAACDRLKRHQAQGRLF